MAYYAIARAMKPLTTGVTRQVKVNARPNLQHEAFCTGKTKSDAASTIAHATPHIYPQRESTYAAWVANSCIEAWAVTLRLRFVSVSTGLDVRAPIERKVHAKPTGTTEVLSGETPEEELTVLISEIFGEEGALIARDVDWPQPLKHMTFADRGLKITANGEDVTVSAKKPVKGLLLTAEGVSWSDNGMDIVPGEPLVINGKGLQKAPTYRYYGME